MLILPIKRYEVVAGVEIGCGLEIMRFFPCFFLVSLISLSLYSIVTFMWSLCKVELLQLFSFYFLETHDFSQAFPT